MNLAKLFDAQRELGKVGLFAYKGEDRFNKLVLALLVELGELANEQRSWKFWSKDREPRILVSGGSCLHCAGTGNKFYDDDEEGWEWCEYCEDGETYKNPLLEEYVDGLHFVLELGIELDFSELHLIGNVSMPTSEITEMFIDIYQTTTLVKNTRNKIHYSILFEEYLVLGEMLGFTWEQIEQAYFEKNKLNHTRQDSGY
ncbi:dUTP diphosphatase [Mesobacillus subterraneus]|uniref:dUTP diphosphatase n=1 Tax=Mesobacillus subterraneus TaxID=285983 RepID=UPI00203EDD10|nr:dUTP diphosphatase [Mesobacillus subterraneus]MCM3665528.1 dUTP diphosphatase [Mesobacillus subterraneus]MCM3686087.1 dUTP diphosphatase [Mesobacillus subterraneus]